MCGRKSHRVQTSEGDLFSIPVERVFDAHAAVRQSALVGLGLPGAERPLLLVERHEDARLGGEALVDDLLVFAAGSERTAEVKQIAIYPEAFPVDVRHNAKIVREELKVWAEKRFGP